MGNIGRMEAALAEISVVPESEVFATSVHTKETTEQFFGENGHGVTERVEDGLVKFFGGQSYQAVRLRKFPDLALLTDRGYTGHDSVYNTVYRGRFRDCRTIAWYVRGVDIGMLEIHSNSCRLRWCPMCAEARANIIAHSCREFFERQSSVRFLTLTLKHSELSLKEQIVRLKKSFKKLRSCSVWRKKVTGCIWFLQIKPSGGGKWWHVHLHMLLTGSYIPQGWISEKWLKITGDSKIVDIRSVYNLGSALKDIVRYAGRPANLLDVSSEYVVELIHATERIRVCGTTGICKSVSLRPPKFRQDDSRYEKLGRYSTIQRLAASGDEFARDIVRAERNHAPLPNAHSFMDVDDFIDDKFTGLDCRDPPDMDVVVEPDSFWDL